MRTILLKFAFIIFLTLFCFFVSNAQENDKNQEKDCPQTGVVTLRVTFDQSIKFIKAEIITSAGCIYFDEKALKAASELKPNPPKKKSKKPTIVKLVEFSFRRTD